MNGPALDALDAPFDQYQRYRITAAVARALAERTGAAPRVLDVGGSHVDFWGRWHRPIAEFLPEQRTLTVDLPRNTCSGYLRARGDALPFRGEAFDLVCSVDVLEHVPVSARQTVLEQASRTAARAIVLAAPFRSSYVERAEALVADFIRRACGYEQGQLQEHRDLGWPVLAETVQALSRLGWTALVLPYGSVWRWTLMMIDKHAVQALAGGRRLQARLDRAYNDERFAADRESPCYRHFIIATRAPDDALLQWAARELGATTLQELASRGQPDEATDTLMFDLLRLHARNQELQILFEPERREAHVEEVESHRGQAFEALAALQSENDRLSVLLRSVETSPTFRLAGWAKRLLRRQP